MQPPPVTPRDGTWTLLSARCWALRIIWVSIYNPQQPLLATLSFVVDEKTHAHEGGYHPVINLHNNSSGMMNRIYLQLLLKYSVHMDFRLYVPHTDDTKIPAESVLPKRNLT